jgi:hypothetical protein
MTWLSGKLPLGSVDTSGDVTINSGGVVTIIGAKGIEIRLATGISDETISGTTILGTITPAATFGQALHIHTDGTYVLADADDEALLPCQGLAVDTGSGADKKILYQGLIRNDAWSWDEGDPIYVSSTSGGLTQTKPTTTGQFVQIVGFAVSSTIMYFNPQLVMVEVG